jgi:hypothetical protein
MDLIPKARIDKIRRHVGPQPANDTVCLPVKRDRQPTALSVAPLGLFALPREKRFGQRGHFFDIYPSWLSLCLDESLKVEVPTPPILSPILT